MFSVLSSIWRHASLIRKLSMREVERRFKGTTFGLLWALVSPLLMLATYTFAFGTVFGAKWIDPALESPLPYPLVIFSGLMISTLLIEILTRAPGLILENVSYVKKVVFPLEIIPVVSVGSALVTMFMAFAVFLLFYFFAIGTPPLTSILVPLQILPLLAMLLGLSYFLASLGVFLRDIGQVVPPLATALMLTSTTFFHPDQLPEQYQTAVLFNPLTIPITGFRDLVFYGRLPDLQLWFTHAGFSILILAAGAMWFERTKKAFADVL